MLTSDLPHDLPDPGPSGPCVKRLEVDDSGRAVPMRGPAVLHVKPKELPPLLKCTDVSRRFADAVIRRIIGHPESAVKELDFSWTHEDVHWPAFDECGPVDEPHFATAKTISTFLETNTALERLVLSSPIIPAMMEVVMRSVEKNVALKEVAFNAFHGQIPNEETKKNLYRLMVLRPSLKITHNAAVTVPANIFGPGYGFSSNEWKKRFARVNVLTEMTPKLPTAALHLVMDMTMGTDTIRSFAFDDIVFDFELNDCVPHEGGIVDSVARIMCHGARRLGPNLLINDGEDFDGDEINI